MSSKFSDKTLLLKLPYAELQVFDLQQELEARSIAFGKKMLKAQLIESLRVALEPKQEPAFLIQLRNKEIQALSTFKKKPLKAKLQARGLAHSGTKNKQAARLLQALEKEKAEFEAMMVKSKNSPKVSVAETVPPPPEQPLVPKEAHANDEKKLPALTQEQRDRIEQNRKRALERLAEQARKKQHVASTPVVAPRVTPSSSRPSNPYAARFSNPYATMHSPALNTPASPAVASLSQQTPPPCTRCGCTGGGLCVVWNHSGDIQRERGMFGDEFRYPCCGRLDPQPCFVGRHSTSIIYNDDSRPVQCRCWKPAHVKRVQKAGPNCGRYFFRCNSIGRGECDFFKWADEAFGLPKQVPRVSLDGVKEWDFPYANPLGERVLITTDVSLNRKRAIAALLLHEMCVSVSGSNGFVCSMSKFDELIPKVIEIVKSSEDIVKNLYPLTQQQVTRRFGPLSAMDDLTEDECENVLMELLEKGSHVHSLGVRLVEIKRMPDSPSVKFADCSGLEAYLAV